MELTSNELLNAAVVPSSTTAVAPNIITNAQVKDTILAYLAQRDYTLPKYFEQGYANASPAASFEEAMRALQSNLRKHLINRAAKDEHTYHQHAQIINHIFDNIQNLMDLLMLSGVKYECNALIVSLIGNMLKSLV